MSRASELEAELEVVRLEDKLVKAKSTKAGASDELKQELRAARQAFREQREAAGDGDEGTARPAAVKATARARKD